MGNSRIQVFDNEGNVRSNESDPDDLENGEIYKMELDGRIVGKLGMAGHRAGEFGTVNAIDCRQADTLWVACGCWRAYRRVSPPSAAAFGLASISMGVRTWKCASSPTTRFGPAPTKLWTV